MMQLKDFETLLKSKVVPWIKERSTDQIPFVTNLLLAVLLAHGVARFTWTVLPEPEFPPAPVFSQRTTASTQARSSVAENLSQWHLFGQADLKVPTTDEPITAPETALNLKLKGVIASRTEAGARAIIEDGSGEEDFYGIGSSLPGGATLEQIHPDRVILKRNNRFETLTLPKEVAQFANLGQVAPPRPATSYNQFDNTNNSALLRQYRDALLNEPQSVMGLMRARPYTEGGKLMGYRIRPGNDKELFDRFGLKTGDVVTSVNGINLDNPVKGLEVLQNLQGANQVSVEILRNGTRQNMTFNLNQ